MKKIRRAIENIKAISTAKNIKELTEMFQKNSKNFATAQKSWFRPLKGNEIDDMSDSDLEFIISYISLAISMHVKAIPHKKIEEIILHFSAELSDRIEPIISIAFDSSHVDIAIDELWKTDLDLDRTMKKECISLAEMIWFEYRSSINSEQLIDDAQIICEYLRTLYPAVQVSYIFFQ